MHGGGGEWRDVDAGGGGMWALMLEGRGQGVGGLVGVRRRELGAARRCWVAPAGPGGLPSAKHVGSSLQDTARHNNTNAHAHTVLPSFPVAPVPHLTLPCPNGIVAMCCCPRFRLFSKSSTLS